MSKLLKIEFKKIRKSLAFKATLIICAVMCIMNVGLYVIMSNISDLGELLGEMGITGYGIFSSCMTQSTDAIMLTTIVLCIMIGGDFSARTLQSQIVAGYSRIQIVISRLISSFVILFIFDFVYTFILTGGISLFIGFGTEFTAKLFGEMVISFLMSIFMSYSIMTLYMLIVFIFKSVGPSIGITMPLMLIGTSVIQIFVQLNETAAKIFSFTPYGQMYVIGDFTLQAVDYFKFFSIGAVYIVAMTVIIILNFRKAELK